MRQREQMRADADAAYTALVPLLSEEIERLDAMKRALEERTADNVYVWENVQQCRAFASGLKSSLRALVSSVDTLR